MATGMEPIGEIIRRVLSRRGLGAGIREAEVLGRWPDIVGETLAKQTDPIAIEQGILFIRVPDSAWRNELSMMKEELVKKINTAFGEIRVTRIHLV